VLLPSRLTTLSKRIFRIAAGHHFSLLLSDQGTLFVTGDNSSGQLGLPRNKSTALLPTAFPHLDGSLIVRVSAGRHAGAITDKGELFIWGPTTYGKFHEPQLLGLMTSEKFSDLQIGSNFGVAVGRSGELYSWGNNVSGELGVGDFSEKKTGIFPINFLKDKRVLTFSCGENHVIAIGEVCTADKGKSLITIKNKFQQNLLI
jgi:alpha-tubulin suppressor-like RCC1 family protein